MIQLYETELLSLAHGALVKKKINGNDYTYIQYRDGKKVVSKYIGKSEEKIAEVKEQLTRRHQIEIILKQLRAEYALVKKYMEVSG